MTRRLVVLIISCFSLGCGADSDAPPSADTKGDVSSGVDTTQDPGDTAEVQDTAPPPSCEEIAAQAQAFLLEKIEEMRQCQAPTPCFVVPIEGDCFNLCAQTVGFVGMNEANIKEANETICAQREGCTYPPANCPPPSSAFTDCVDGLCEPLQ